MRAYVHVCVCVCVRATAMPMPGPSNAPSVSWALGLVGQSLGLNHSDGQNWVGLVGVLISGLLPDLLNY